MSSPEETILALQEVVGDLLARIQALESATSGGGSESNVPLGIRLQDFQRDLPDQASVIPNGTEDGQMLIWNNTTKAWIPTTQAELFNDPESPPSDGDLLQWNESEGRWVGVASSERSVVIDVDWDGDSLRQQKQLVRVIPSGDPSEYETIVTATECE